MIVEQEKDEDSNSDVIKILHRQSSTFISDFASGAVITGPTIEKLYFITFFSEAVSVKHEVGRITQSEIQENVGNDTTYQLTMDQAEVESFREDKARIILSHDTLISLRDLLNKIKL